MVDDGGNMSCENNRHFGKTENKKGCWGTLVTEFWYHDMDGKCLPTRMNYRQTDIKLTFWCEHYALVEQYRFLNTPSGE